jgi:hypothetical protein
LDLFLPLRLNARSFYDLLSRIKTQKPSIN